jgi:hypothetical protein
MSVRVVAGEKGTLAAGGTEKGAADAAEGEGGRQSGLQKVVGFVRPARICGCQRTRAIAGMSRPVSWPG